MSERIDRAAFLKRAGGLFALALFDPSSTWSHDREPLPHPDPRPGITADKVLKASELGDRPKKGVLSAYDAAREMPQVFDGLACGCGCSDHAGTHRSLLVCYESMQPTGCASCREEADFVAKMARDGKTLAEIRTAVDKKFG